MRPQRRTHCQETEKLGSRMLRRQCAARMHCNATKFLGNRMQQDNAQPSAAYALPRKRNSWAIGCNKTMRSPQRRTHCQENEMLSCRMLRRHCAAHSGVRIAKKTNSWAIGCNKTTRSSAAYALASKRNSGAIGCNKTMRSPQRRTHCHENEMLGCRMLRRHCAAHSGVRIAKKTKFLGNRMQQDNAQYAAEGCALSCCIRLPRNSFSWQCVRRCGLRSVFVASDSSTFRFLGNAYAAEGCALSCCIRLPRNFVFLAMRTPLWAAQCLRSIRQPNISFSWQCVRR